MTGFTAVNLGVDFPIKLNSRATVTPYVAANLPMAGLRTFARNASYYSGFGGPQNAFTNLIYWGVTLSVRF